MPHPCPTSGRAGRSLCAAAAVLSLLSAGCRNLATHRPRPVNDIPVGPMAYDVEVAIGGSAIAPNGVRGLAALDASLGYHLTSHESLQLRNRTLYSERYEARGASLLDLTWERSLGDHTLRPFVGPSFGVSYGESINESGAIGGHTGVRWFAQPRAAVTMDGAYHYMFAKTADPTEVFTRNLFTWSIGISLLF